MSEHHSFVKPKGTLSKLKYGNIEDRKGTAELPGGTPSKPASCKLSNGLLVIIYGVQKDTELQEIGREIDG